MHAARTHTRLVYGAMTTDSDLCALCRCHAGDWRVLWCPAGAKNVSWPPSLGKFAGPVFLLTPSRKQTPSMSFYQRAESAMSKARRGGDARQVTPTRRCRVPTCHLDLGLGQATRPGEPPHQPHAQPPARRRQRTHSGPLRKPRPEPSGQSLALRSHVPSPAHGILSLAAPNPTPNPGTRQMDTPQ